MTAVHTTSASAPTTLDQWLGEHGEGLIALRRNIHAHPELSGDEHATTELVAERLELAGLAPRQLSVGTGLVCDLAPPTDTGARRVLALRADLDALAMPDEKQVSYASQTPGVAHACGHDVHTAVVLGTALYFAHHLDELPGPLRVIFQPAEERVPGGALDVLADGGIDDVDAIVGLHCEPKLDVGTMGLRAGAISSAADMAVIRLRGRGGHTARPELTDDLIALAARVVQELPVRVAARVGADDAVKVVFGAVHAGDAPNVIPTSCELRAAIRTPSLAVWELLPEIVEEELGAIVAITSADVDLDYTHGVPPVVNDPAVTEMVRRAVTDTVGGAAVITAEQSWGGDDFAWFTREIPGTYVRLGVRDPAGPTLDLHAGHFDVDERSIEFGVRLLVGTVHTFHGERGTRVVDLNDRHPHLRRRAPAVRGTTRMTSSGSTPSCSSDRPRRHQRSRRPTPDRSRSGDPVETDRREPRDGLIVGGGCDADGRVEPDSPAGRVGGRHVGTGGRRQVQGPQPPVRSPLVARVRDHHV